MFLIIKLSLFLLSWYLILFGRFYSKPHLYLLLQKKMEYEDITPEFSFVYLPDKHNPGLENRNTQEYLKKWGINLMTQSFSFNQPYQQYHRCDFTEAFFKDPLVAEKLKIWDASSLVFKEAGIIASEVDVRPVPCTIESMTFFERLSDPKNEIVHESGSIRPTQYDYIDDILIPNCLRAMILDDNNDKYNLYSKSERAEFIFRLFQMLVIGGSCCQYEDDLKIYLDITKILYKTFVRVELTPNEDGIEILSTILEVVAKKNDSYYPWKPECLQNIGFLIIDPINQEVTTFLHQY